MRLPKRDIVKLLIVFVATCLFLTLCVFALQGWQIDAPGALILLLLLITMAVIFAGAYIMVAVIDRPTAPQMPNRLGALLALGWFAGLSLNAIPVVVFGAPQYPQKTLSIVVIETMALSMAVILGLAARSALRERGRRPAAPAGYHQRPR